MSDDWNRETIQALPPEVVAYIWKQTEFERTPTTDEIRKRRYRKRNAFVVAFCEIAIDHPHYAHPAAIARALGIPNSTAARTVNEIINDARRNRLTTGT